MFLRLGVFANDFILPHHATDPITQKHSDIWILPQQTEVIGFIEQKQQNPQADQEQQIAEACTNLGHGIKSFSNNFTSVNMPQSTYIYIWSKHIPMRSILFGTALLSLISIGCSDEDDENNGPSIPNDYSGVYSGLTNTITSGTLIGADTISEDISLVITKDAVGHYIWAPSANGDDSTKVYFNMSGQMTYSEDADNLATVTSVSYELQYIANYKMDVHLLQTFSVPVVNIELGRVESTGMLTRQ